MQKVISHIYVIKIFAFYTALDTNRYFIHIIKEVIGIAIIDTKIDKKLVWTF